MRHDSVMIKTNAYGLTLFLDPDIPFEQLLEDTGSKFAQAARFFRNAQMALTFRGRALSEQEELAMVDVITANADLHIICLVDENKEHARISRIAMEEAIAKNINRTADIYEGTLKNGMKLEIDRSIIILGDVNPGAAVVSSGNVIILGCCMGHVTAGVSGDESCFVAALTLLPAMLRIAHTTARSAITKREDTGEYPIEPRIVYLKNSHLVFEHLRGNAFEHIAALSHVTDADEGKEASAQEQAASAHEQAAFPQESDLPSEDSAQPEE